MNLVAMICLLVLGIGGYLFFAWSKAAGGNPLLAGGPAGEMGATGERFEFHSPGVNLLAVPLALCLGFLLKNIWWAIGFLFHVTLHEIGHSLAAWLRGYWSFPVPAGIALISAESSPIMFAVMIGVILCGLNAGVTRKSPQLIILSLLLAAGQIYLTFAVDELGWRAWMLFGGCAGEFVIAALILMMFYHRLPDVMRWDFFRYPFMVMASCTLMAATFKWLTAAPDPEHLILYGEAISTSRDMGHDMVKLVREYGWTPQQIVDRYLFLAKICFAGVSAYYLWFLSVAYSGKPQPAPAAAE